MALCICCLIMIKIFIQWKNNWKTTFEGLLYRFFPPKLMSDIGQSLEMHVPKTFPKSSRKLFFEKQGSSGLDFLFFFFLMVAVSIVAFERSEVPLMVCKDELASDSNGSRIRCSGKQQAEERCRVCQEFCRLICCLVQSPGTMPCSNLFLAICS